MDEQVGGRGLGGMTKSAVVPNLRRVMVRRVKMRRALLAADNRSDPDAERFWLEVGRELERSRRHDRSFGLVRFQLDRSDRALTSVEAIGAWRSALRDSDGLLFEDDALVVMLTDLSGQGLEAAIARLKCIADGALAIAPMSLVRFPDDALTAAGLIDRLYCPTVENSLGAVVESTPPYEQAS